MDDDVNHPDNESNKAENDNKKYIKPKCPDHLDYCLGNPNKKYHKLFFLKKNILK